MDEKKIAYYFVIAVCLFWILFNVVFPFISASISVVDGSARRGWRGRSINYHPDIDTYISEYLDVNGIYQGYNEGTSVGEPEYWIKIDNGSYMCVFMKQCYLDTLNYCLGKNITLHLEQFSQYSCFSSDKNWVIIGLEYEG